MKNFVDWAMKKQQKNKGGKEEGRVHIKYVHVTLHGLENSKKDYWIEKARTFRKNVVAVLVGLEENHEEGKGIHAHIFIQFSTKQMLSRKQFVDHFETDCLHISTRKSKDDLMQGLGYVSKTGNTSQYGVFTYRGQELDTNPEVYRFKYEVQSIEDGMRYFDKVIQENLGKDENIIEKFEERNDDIGRWLRQHRQHAMTLHKLAHRWALKHSNENKRGFRIKEFVSNNAALERAYNVYLKEFPEIFEKYLPGDSPIVLERDFVRHKAHDLKVIASLCHHLNTALKYGHKRPLKELNVYLWSRHPSFGKTRLLNFLDDHMMTYRLPDDQYYVNYQNGLYQILVSDEAKSFIGSKPYSHLKHIFEGQRVEFNRKGKTKIYKKDNPLMVLADNISFDQLMKEEHAKSYSREVMLTRVKDLELRSRATLHFFLDRCLVPISENGANLPILAALKDQEKNELTKEK